MATEFRPDLPVCPHLPAVARPLTAAVARAGRAGGPAADYRVSLDYAQSLWREGKPAQALLQLNRAWAADLQGDEAVLREWPPPYRALDWILRDAGRSGFLGNPVRHFQHLATRMNAVRPVPRRWRAWAGMHLAARLLDPRDFPPDEPQRLAEKLVIPGIDEVIAGLETHGWAGEAAVFTAVWENA